MRKLISLAWLPLVVAGCSSGDSPEVTCMKQALVQPELSNGRVIFGRIGELPLSLQANVLFGTGLDADLPMASLTKPLVAEQIRKKIASGEFDLETPFAKLLPGMRVHALNRRTTLRQLLQHQGGFDRSAGDPLFATNKPDCAMAAADIAFRPPEVEPGTRVLYSNAGYCLLGRILLAHPSGMPAGFREVVSSPLGAAGGWHTTLPAAYAAYQRLLPVHDLPSSVRMADGSYYAYAWRHDPHSEIWTHFGRLPGMLSIAVTDGDARLLLAYFDGDPKDDSHSAAVAGRAMWACVRGNPRRTPSLSRF